MIRFAVDDVAPAPDRRPLVALAAGLGEHMALGAAVAEVIDAPAVHPLLAAVHVAFAEHRPLVLSPDAIWLTIAQGVAQHVRLHAGTLRSRLVRHESKQTLKIEWPRVPSAADDWAAVVAAFRGEIARLVGDGRARLFACDFSTSTPESATAGDIVLMDVYSPYLDYELMCVCGIPEITLLGTPADWRSIRARIDVINELDLGFWTGSLREICDQLVATAEGRIDTKFWQGIYKPREAYGGDIVTGWVARLFPYVSAEGRFEQRNYLLDVDINRVEEEWKRRRGNFGIRLEDVPLGTSQALVRLTGLVEIDVTLEGGLLGVSQDAEGRLAPVAGWLARRGSTSVGALIDRLIVEHQVEPPPSAERGPRDRGFTGPAELVALFEKIDGATLWSGQPRAWRIRPPAEHETVEIGRGGKLPIRLQRIVDLPDGSFLACCYSREGVRWVRLRSDALGPMPPREIDYGGIRVRVDVQRPTSQPASEISVLAGGLADLITFALDHEGSTDLPRRDQTLADLAVRY